jgi:hypothetical protein
MSFREFLGKMTPKFILIRFGLSLAFLAILVPLFVHFFTHKLLTVSTFLGYFFMVAFPVTILSVVHLIEARSRERKECERKNDA